MRNTRALTMIVLSLIAGIAAVAFANRWLQSQAAAGIRQVAVATVDVPAGEELQPEHYRMVAWPAGSVPSGAFLDAEGLKERVLKVAVQRDEPILESKLAPQGTRGGLSAVISKGKRAITVRVNDVIGVAGFALPGTLVDVIVSTKRPGKESEEDINVSKIVLEKILVLAVAQEAGREETRPRVVNAVTLEVTPDQAEKLDLARSVGTLSLVLRNQVDVQDAATGGATKDTLLGLVKPAPVAKPAPVRIAAAAPAPAPAPRAKVCIDALVGTNRTTECF